eukprot:TRINITY_DN12705_c1_g2_i2.p1 TRINITY_DN12705_c1_g2~~TRINITY_DN12705_c1_g2_i2.p1  ORF type:complete len:398 (+),score=67.58 TRINITY_DN12705_c1_g2_i2:116-1309(+)
MKMTQLWLLLFLLLSTAANADTSKLESVVVASQLVEPDNSESYFKHQSPEEDWSSAPHSDDSDNVLQKCTHNAICRMSILCFIVLCVVVGVCVIIRKNRPKFVNDASSSGNSSPTLLNAESAFAVADYQAHEELWPGPNEWKRLSAHQRGKITAKIVKSTTDILRGNSAAASAKLLNIWVRGEEGIYNDDIELVKESLDKLICSIDPSQLAVSPDLGEPWPKQSRWRRLPNRRKATIYAEYIKGRITQRKSMKRYYKWVRERGYIIQRVETAAEEASQTLDKIEQEKPVAFSDVRGCGEEVLGKAITDEDAWEAGSGQEEKEQPQFLVPELSITVASPANNTTDPLGPQLKADSLSLFSRYVLQSPRLSDSDSVASSPTRTYNNDSEERIALNDDVP